MRGRVLACAVAAALLAARPCAAADDVRAVDVRQSRATFAVQHALVDRVTGTVPIVAATVRVAADGVTPVAVEAALDARRVDSGDADRDADLQGPDWFDTKRFARWTFKSTNVAPAGPRAYTIAGVLTLHGTGVPVTLATTLVRGAPDPAYHAVAHVDRHAFGMTVTRADALVGTDVTITLDVRTR
ncbi:MAG: YceI family protein [Candidatus Velthaea sp.]